MKHNFPAFFRFKTTKPAKWDRETAVRQIEVRWENMRSRVIEIQIRIERWGGKGLCDVWFFFFNFICFLLKINVCTFL